MTRSPQQLDRFQLTAHLDAPVAQSRFMDGARVRALNKLHIETIRDLMRHFPNRYIDMSEVRTLRDTKVGSEVTVVGRVHEIVEKRPRTRTGARLSITEITIFDGTGILVGVWFSQPWVASRYQVGEKVAFSGKVVHKYGNKRMDSPFVEKLSFEEDDDRKVGRILPIHPATEGLSTNWIRRLVAAALDDHHGLVDHLPPRLREQQHLMRLDSAYRAIHFPHTQQEAVDAKYRFVYEELFLLQLYLAIRKQLLTYQVAGNRHVTSGPHLTKLRAAIPFELTGEQDTAVDDILKDMAREEPMNRMLLGDVGTGKTVVAAHALAVVADSGTQAAMMAPTEVLAQQYRNALGPLLDKAGITWALLTGSTPAADRMQILSGVASGETTVLFGTHALLEDKVEFNELTLAIVDEQHRFGVNQRTGLREKGKGVDLLVMTATPIPRTLALTLYGDLDSSYIRERPKGRPGVTTLVKSKHDSGQAYEMVRDEIKAGHQAYIVCPLVGVKKSGRDEEGERKLEADLARGTDISNLKAATSHADLLQRKIFPEFKVGLLTGPMKPADKARVMADFKAGTIDILVSTTVIEVGVDVPNATIMVIEDAERFGLSQLHQLRGRVGRGDSPGTLIVFADGNTKQAKARMKALASTSDGFELAEYDLELRKEGDILGDRQHGMPALKLANLIGDKELIERTRHDALLFLADDPLLQKPENALLLHELKRVYKHVWGLN